LAQFGFQLLLFRFVHVPLISTKRFVNTRRSQQTAAVCAGFSPGSPTDRNGLWEDPL